MVQYRLNPHGYSFDFVSDVDCNIFQPRIQNFQARKILVSSRENFTLNTRTNYIPYENEVYSRIEHKILSAGNKYFPGLKILYSRQENASINVRNKIKVISMGI